MEGRHLKGMHILMFLLLIISHTTVEPTTTTTTTTTTTATIVSRTLEKRKGEFTEKGSEKKKKHRIVDQDYEYEECEDEDEECEEEDERDERKGKKQTKQRQEQEDREGDIAEEISESEFKSWLHFTCNKCNKAVQYSTSLSSYFHSLLN